MISVLASLGPSKRGADQAHRSLDHRRGAACATAPTSTRQKIALVLWACV